MRIGITLGHDQPDHAREARWIEEAGFDQVSTGEHLFFHGPTANSFVTLAAAAGATQHIRLLSALTIVPVYPPAILAKLVSSLDQVSGGRFDLGVGVGGEYPKEFEAAGVDPKQRGARTDEALEVLRPLLAGEELTREGQFSRFPGVRLQPAAVQQPRPPIWMGGRKPAAMRRAARFADVWLPYMYTPAQLDDSLTQVNKYAVEYGRPEGSLRGAVHCWAAVDRHEARARQQVIDVVSTVYQQDFTPLADRYLLHGNPERVIERLREYHQAGARDLVFAAAEWDPTKRADMLSLLATEVLPEVRGWDQ